MQSYLRRLLDRLHFEQDRGHRYLMVAHLFDDTLRMVQAMAPAVTFDAIIGIPYSSNREGLEVRWRRNLGSAVHVPNSMDALEERLIAELDRSLNSCAENGQRLIVQEVGGFVVPLLHSRFADRVHLVKGVVELTKQGVWRSQDIDLAFPVLHCAESELKRLEAKRCGETIVRCIDGLIRERGLSLAGRFATVFGAGWIGRGVADGLRSLDAVAALVDRDPLKVVEARLDGFLASSTDAWSARSHVVIGATGRTSISADTLMGLANNTIVASASSRQLEIEVGFLHGLPSEKAGDALVEYRLPSGDRQIFLINDGYPANFIPGSGSVPDEIVEPILGELVVLLRALTVGRYKPGIHAISKEQERACADLWLAMRDEDFLDRAGGDFIHEQSTAKLQYGEIR